MRLFLSFCLLLLDLWTKHAVMSMNARPTTNPTTITIVFSRPSETGFFCWLDPLFPIGGALVPDLVGTVVGFALLGGVVASCGVVAVVGNVIFVVVACGAVVVVTGTVVAGEVVVGFVLLGGVVASCGVVAVVGNVIFVVVVAGGAVVVVTTK